MPATAGEAVVAGQRPPGYHRATRPAAAAVCQMAERRDTTQGRVMVVARQLSCCGDVGLLDRAGVGRAVGAGEPACPHTCPGCGANAWAKPETKLVCGECNEGMEAEEQDAEDD